MATGSSSTSGRWAVRLEGKGERMRFDSGLPCHPGDISTYPQIDEWVDTAKFLEGAGYAGLWVAEHHFFWDGWATPTPTNPLLFCAFLAGQTSTLRLGQCGVCLPDWHPIRVAEDIAMLDHMTRGRIDFGMIRGLNNRVAGNFNVDADRRSQEKNKKLFWESYDVITQALSGPFCHRGEFYSLPVPGWTESGSEDELDPTYYSADGELIALSIQPRPFQQPGPPMWVMADSPSSTAEAAARGLGVISWGQSFESARNSASVYRKALPAGAEERAGIMRPVFVAPTRAEAEAVMRPAVNQLLAHVVGKTPAWNSRKAFLGPDEELTERDVACDWFDFLNEKEWCFVGSPDDVAERVAHYRDEIGCEHLVLYWALPCLEFDQIMGSLGLFADEVMPHFA